MSLLYLYLFPSIFFLILIRFVQCHLREDLLEQFSQRPCPSWRECTLLVLLRVLPSHPLSKRRRSCGMPSTRPASTVVWDVFNLTKLACKESITCALLEDIHDFGHRGAPDWVFPTELRTSQEVLILKSTILSLERGPASFLPASNRLLK